MKLVSFSYQTSLRSSRGYRIIPAAANQAMHTIQSHGVINEARFHVYDWLTLLVLVALEAVLELVIHPFHRFVSKDMMVDLKYPLKPNTVPTWTVPLYAGVLPIVVFVIFYLRRRNVYDLHNAILGLLYAMLTTAIVTSAIKNAVGRPRPNFFWRCFPEGNENYDSLGNVVCNGKKSDIIEGYKSFPSGHSSVSFSGLGFLSLYLAAKIKAFDHKGHVAKLCVVFLPLLAATFVAISRVDDYWHHWQDVLIGGLLGFVVALFCYHQFFPPPYDVNGWEPYASLLALEERHRDNEEERAPASDQIVDDTNTEVHSNDYLNTQNRQANIDSLV